MKRIVNSIISVILAISMVLCTNLINVNAKREVLNYLKDSI